MASKSEYEKYSYALILAGVVIMVANFYYYLHPALASVVMTSEVMDLLFFRLRAGGVFSSPAVTKVMAFSLIALALLTYSGKPRPVSLWIVLVVACFGAVLYLFPFIGQGFYVLTTVSGLTLLCWSVSKLNRRGQHASDDNTEESFRQCTQLIDTKDSINIPTRFKYQKQTMHGWVNVVNPFRATLVLGNPGSGKSYSVYEPFIEQMIAKGYSMFVYDYKYPSLSLKVYNEVLQEADAYPVLPEFHVIDMNNPTHSNRCNPLHPRYIKDPADASEIAELIMLNVNKAAIEKEDFFTQSAKVILESVIWFLRQYENGRFCTFPHVIEFMTQDYKEIIKIMKRYPEIMARMKPFANAMKGNAQEQLQGQLASAQIPLLKFVSPSLYWTLTGDDFSLEINDPEHPRILCVGNDPDRQMIYGTTIALITSRMFKAINKPGKLKCGVLLDEFPTVYLKGIDNLIATARSNKVAVVIGAQDKSQIRRDYGDKESEVIFNTVGNLFAGQVSGRTAEALSKTFGRELRERSSFTYSHENDSVSSSKYETEIMPIRRIETLSQGVFIGKIADNNTTKIQDKLFCGEIVRNFDEIRSKQKLWKPIPQVTDFGEDRIEREIRKAPDTYLAAYIIEMETRKGLLYQPDQMKVHVEGILSKLSDRKRSKYIEDIVRQKRTDIVENRIQENFLRVQADVRSIIDKENGSIQSFSDPRVNEPFAGL